MAHSRYYRHLKLPENPLKRGFTLPRSTSRNHYEVFGPKEILSGEVIRRFGDAGLRVKTVALFYKRPGSQGIIHSDVAWVEGRWRKNIAAVNWNLSGARSLMSWYKIDVPGVEPDPMPARRVDRWYHALNGIHFGYVGSRDQVNIPKGKFRVLASACIESATLVRTDVPHGVENTDDAKGRWALSVRCDPDFGSWQEAVSAFAPFLKNGA